MAGLHGIISLHPKAWGCPPHSRGGAQRLRPLREAVAFPPEAAQADEFAASDDSGSGALDIYETLKLLRAHGLQPFDPKDERRYFSRVARRAASVGGLPSPGRREARSPSRQRRAAGGGIKYGGAVLPQAAADASLELDQALWLFRHHDADRSGLLERAEFDALMQRLAASQAPSSSSDEEGRRPYSAIELDALWAQADTDASGTVDLNELLVLFRHRCVAS